MLVLIYFANCTAIIFLITVTLITPGYLRFDSIAFDISFAKL
ncbi:MAG: hypothetical protein ACK4ZM_03770 [bacterium]